MELGTFRIKHKFEDVSLGNIGSELFELLLSLSEFQISMFPLYTCHSYHRIYLLAPQTTFWKPYVLSKAGYVCIPYQYFQVPVFLVAKGEGYGASLKISSVAIIFVALLKARFNLKNTQDPGRCLSLLGLGLYSDCLRIV